MFTFFKRQQPPAAPAPSVQTPVDAVVSVLESAHLPTAAVDETTGAPAGVRVTADARTLCVVVESAGTRRVPERALAFGLRSGRGRRLALLLPRDSVDELLATRSRVALLSGASIDVYSYDDSRATVLPPVSIRMMRSGAAEPDGVLRAGEYRVPTRLAAVAEPIETWADGEPDLLPRHLRSARAWACEGQRVLTIRSVRGGLRVVADTDAGALTVTLTAPPTPAELEEIIDSVRGAVARRQAERVPGYREHRVLATVERAARSWGWTEGHVTRQLPCRRPGGASGHLPFLRLDAQNVLHLVEVAHSRTELLAIRGLDAWMWASENREAIARYLGVPFVSATVVDLVVVGASDDVDAGTSDDADADADADVDADATETSSFSVPDPLAALRLQLAALDPLVAWELHELAGWDTAAPTLRTIARSEEREPREAVVVAG